MPEEKTACDGCGQVMSQRDKELSQRIEGKTLCPECVSKSYGG